MTDLVEKYESRITRLEVTQEHILLALTDIRSAIEKLDTRMNDRIDKMEHRFENRIWSLHFWNLASFVGIIGLMDHGFGWI